MLAVTLLQTVPVDTTAKLSTYGGIKKLNKSEYPHSVSCFGIPTCKTGRGKWALEHEDMARNWKLTLVLVYCVQQWMETWKLFFQDVEYKLSSG